MACGAPSPPTPASCSPTPPLPAAGFRQGLLGTRKPSPGRQLCKAVQRDQNELSKSRVSKMGNVRPRTGGLVGDEGIYLPARPLPPTCLPWAWCPAAGSPYGGHLLGTPGRGWGEGGAAPPQQPMGGRGGRRRAESAGRPGAGRRGRWEARKALAST